MGRMDYYTYPGMYRDAFEELCIEFLNDFTSLSFRLGTFLSQGSWLADFELTNKDQFFT